MSYFKYRNLLLVLALLLAVILVAVITMRYRPASQLQAISKALPAGVDVSLQDIDYTHIEDGRSRWRLVAKQVNRQSASGIMAISNPRLSVYDEQGETQGTLEAGEGEVSNDYRQVRLRENVILKNSADYILYTDSLDYDQTTQLATTDEYVRMVGKGMQLEGTGLAFHLREKRLALRTNVKGKFDSIELK